MVVDHLLLTIYGPMPRTTQSLSVPLPCCADVVHIHDVIGLSNDVETVALEKLSMQRSDHR